MMEHTPGPWRIHEDNPSCKTIIGNIKPEPESDLDDEVFRCREIGYTPGLANEDEDLANAQLISAAPDLLAEHREWAEMFGRALIAYLQEDRSVITGLARTLLITNTKGVPMLLSSAISKAEGKEGP